MAEVFPQIDEAGGTIASDANLRAAVGVQFEPYPGNLSTAETAPATQTVYGTLVGVTPGASLTGILFRNGVAAAGSLPTTARFGIADTTGKMVAISANVNALANWAAGPNAIPFSAPYVVPAGSLALYACFVVNGTWGTTQPTPSTVTRVTANSGTAYSTFAAPLIAWQGQTDLPAVGSSLLFTFDTVKTYYLALY